MTDRGPGILTEINITEQDINDIISCLNPQKASGPDDISHRIVALFLDLRIYIQYHFHVHKQGVIYK
jgi:hypothetical protein